MPRRKGGVRRVPQSFDSISIGEQLRWSVGGPCIEGNVELQPGSPILVWPSWQAWVEVYMRCREDFLAHRAQRPHLPTPDSERL